MSALLTLPTKNTAPVPAQVERVGGLFDAENLAYHHAKGWPHAEEAICFLFPILSNDHFWRNNTTRPHVLRVAASTRNDEDGDTTDYTIRGVPHKKRLQYEVVDEWYQYPKRQGPFFYIVRTECAELDAIYLDARLEDQGGPIARVAEVTDASGRRHLTDTFELLGPGMKFNLVAMLQAQEVPECP